MFGVCACTCSLMRALDSPEGLPTQAVCSQLHACAASCSGGKPRARACVCVMPQALAHTIPKGTLLVASAVQPQKGRVGAVCAFALPRDKAVAPSLEHTPCLRWAC